MSRHNAGFTLLETVVAIAIILFGLVSLISLSTTSLVSGEITSDEFVAANIAREGIEVVRAQRDSNWLALSTNPASSVLWNDGLFQNQVGEPGGVDYTAVLTLDPGAPTYFDFSPDSFGDSCTGTTPYDCSLLWQHHTDPIYFQAGEDLYPLFDPSVYTTTRFSRLLSLYPLCRSTVTESDEQVISSGTCSAALGPTYEQVGIDIVVEVRWTGRGEPHSYTVEEHMYDWQ